MNRILDRTPRVDLLRDPLTNRGTALAEPDRERLGLQGLLPPRVESIDEQAERVLLNLRSKATPIERYAYLSALREENETLFFHVAIANLQEILPLIYTPTVGQACQEWSRLYLKPRGLYITPEHKGSIANILRNWPHRDVAIIVVTDGGRILGLGDLGMNGMGIPIGKLALYTACAGIAPSQCLPITLDVGTDTASIRDDPFYLGRRESRLTGRPYDEFIDEFVTATQEVFPNVVVQFEDFNNANAFRLLARYRDRLCCFNDDIQGTGAMGLAGLYAAARITRRKITDERILFLGAGEACLGIGSTVVSALQRAGLEPQEARKRCLFIDSKGTVVKSRLDLPSHKAILAQDRPSSQDLVSTIQDFRPTILFGACGQGGMFTQSVIEAMVKFCSQPVVFALSNPTSRAECTAEQAYAWAGGRVIFASGSPFQPVEIDGRTHAPGQANNSYVFPGVGLGLVVSGAQRVTDGMFFAAAEALAGQISESDLALGRIFPPQSRMRKVARAVAYAVAKEAFEQKVGRNKIPRDLSQAVQDAMFQPEYPEYGDALVSSGVCTIAPN